MRRVRWAERTAITRFFSECSGSSGVQSRRGSFHPYCSGRILVALTPGHVESDLHDRRLVATVLSIACCCEGVWNISLPPPFPSSNCKKGEGQKLNYLSAEKQEPSSGCCFFLLKPGVGKNIALFSLLPRWGTVDAEIRGLFDEKSELSKIPPQYGFLRVCGTPFRGVPQVQKSRSSLLRIQR